MKSIALLYPYFRNNRLRIVVGLLSLMAVDLFQLLIPRVVKQVVDGLTVFEITRSGLLRYGLMILALAVGIATLRYVWRLCLMGLSRQVEEGIRNRLFDHLQRLSAGYFSQARTGDLMAHATNDINHIRMASGMGMVALMDAVVMGLTTIAFMAYINLRLTAFVIIPMPLIVISTRFFSRRMHGAYEEVQGAFSTMTEVVRERFAGIRIIKAYNREAESVSSLEAASRQYIRTNLHLIRITGAFFPMMILFSNLGLTIVIYLGGRQTIYGTITPGDFVAFISYLGMLTWPMMALGWVTNLIQRGKASLDRVNRILETPPAIHDPDRPVPFRRLSQEIRFEQVRFIYPATDETVLGGIDVRIRKGQTLGIVGPPGSGKSSLVHLIPRLYDVTGGAVRLDGVDIREIRIDELREKITLVPQEPFLFAGTIRENITFGDDTVPEEQLIRTAEAVALYGTIREFPKGFETVVGEKGVILSGGQKQRIALARALLRKAEILILDDPISQVDTETGHDIVRNFRAMAGEQTLLIVSHRISAVRYADRIITLREGRITESGTHEELMAQNGYYASTFRMQEIEEELYAV